MGLHLTLRQAHPTMEANIQLSTEAIIKSVDTFVSSSSEDELVLPLSRAPRTATEPNHTRDVAQASFELRSAKSPTGSQQSSTLIQGDDEPEQP